jgi:hypothetical protein
MARTRILLAEDNEALLDELCHELKEEFEIVGRASNGQDAVDGVLRLDRRCAGHNHANPQRNPSLVAHSRESPALEGFVFDNSRKRRICFGGYFLPAQLGMLTKRRLASDLVRAIQEVGRGNVFVSPTLRREHNNPEFS